MFTSRARRLRPTSRLISRCLYRAEPLEPRVLLAVTITATLQDTLLTDVDADTRFDPGDTIQYNVVISNSGDTDATNVMFADLLDAQTTLGTVRVSPLAARDTYNAVGNTRRTVAAGQGLRANDIDIDGLTPQGSLVVTAGTFPTSAGGSVTIAADGSFTYDPQLGDQNVLDTFTYTITDGDGLASNGTCTINLGARVWYVDATAPGGGNGSFVSPFNSLASVSGATGPDTTGDIIYIYERAGDYNGNMTLLANQQLIGSGVALTVNTITVVAASSNTTMTTTAAATDAITLRSNNTVRGFTIGATTGWHITNTAATDVLNLTINAVTLSGTGNLFRADSGGIFAVTIDNATTTSATGNGIHIAGTTAGTFTVTAGALSGCSGAEVLINGGTGTINIGASITSNAGGSIDVNGHINNNITFSGAINITGGSGISVQNITSGTVAFTNASKVVNTGAAAAVSLANNPGGTINFTGGGLDVDTTSGTAFSVTSGGAVTVSGASNTINSTTGTAFGISGGTGAIDVNAPITSTTGRLIDIQSHSGAVTFSANLSNTGTGILVQNNTSGTITFSGATKTLNTGAGAGVTLATNTGATINFTGGGLDIDTTSGTGFSATGGGTVSVQGTGNTIDVTSGSGLLVTNTTIGSPNITFQRISAGTAAGSAGVGISLDTTGSSGRLIVIGAGTAGSGGTIRNKTGADGSTTSGIGVYMNSTTNPSFDRMQLNDFQNFAIRGVNVAGFTLSNSVISSNGAGGSWNGNSAPLDEGSVSFSNLTGSATISNTNISGGFEDNVRIGNTSGTLNRVTFDAVAIGANHNGADASQDAGNDGITIEAAGTANLNATVQNSFFTSARGDLFQFSAPGSGTSDLVFTGNTLSNNYVRIATGGGGVSIGSGSTSAFTFNMSNNTFRDSIGHAVLMVKDFGTGSMIGTFNNNTVGVIGVTNSGSLEGDTLKVQQAGQGTMRTTITNNRIYQYNNFGINLQTGAGIATSGTYSAIVRGNTVSNPGNNPNVLQLQGIGLNGGVTPIDAFQIYLTLGGSGASANEFSNSGAGASVDVRLRQRQSTTIHLTAADAGGNPIFNYTGGNTDLAAVSAFVDLHNGLVDQLHAVNSPPGGGFVGGAPPLLFAPGGDPAIAPQQPDPVSVAVEPIEPAAIIPPEADPVPTIVVPVEPPIVDDGILSPGELDSMVNAAIARWTATGLTAVQVGLLRDVGFTIEDLPGWYLGSARRSQVTLDTDAAGNGWFIDPTPMTDDDVPAGRIDLLTTVMHEMGHVLGLEDTYEIRNHANLMYGFSTLGERRLPTRGQAIGAVPHDHDHGPDFAFTPINVGTLTFGTTIRVRFTAQIANPLVGTGSVSNQGTVSGSNFTSVVTNDPDTGAANDATVTLVQPATPTSPDLQAASDTGSLNTDNLTNAANPVFDASGVDAAATVELLRCGVVVASRTGPGSLTDTGAPAGSQTYNIRQRFGAGGINSDVSPNLVVNIDRTAPAQAPIPDMQAGSDTGSFNDDNVTNDTTPTFDIITGIEADATVTLLFNGFSGGTRTGPGEITPVALDDSVYTVTVRQTDAAGNVGPVSNSVLVRIDTTAPQITGSPVFHFETTQSIVYTFSEGVGPSLAAADIIVQNLSTATTVPDASKVINYVALTDTLTLSFAGFPATLLADGNYRNTIAAAGVTDIAGNPLNATNVFDYFVLAGDANRDRKVDVADLGILATSWQLSPRTFSQGNFDYSPNGLVDIADLGILASHWQQQLALPSAPAADLRGGRVPGRIAAIVL